MLILAVDTSGKNGSIALVRFDNGAQHTLETVPLEGGTFSAQLVPQITSVLQKHHLSKSNIDAFTVVSGPGSFTGLRVGLAAIKALAETLHKPIAAVSLLEALTHTVGDRTGQVISILDAGRGELYVGTFDLARGQTTCIRQELKRMEEFLEEKGLQPIVTPDQRLADSFGAASLQVSLITAPRADTVARLGYEKLQRGETIAPESLDATYIRRSDAEIKFSK